MYENESIKVIGLFCVNVAWVTILVLKFIDSKHMWCHRFNLIFGLRIFIVVGYSLSLVFELFQNIRQNVRRNQNCENGDINEEKGKWGHHKRKNCFVFMFSSLT